MTKEQMEVLLKGTCRFLRQKMSLLIVACMLGISNIILDEVRMVNDTRARVEQQEIQPEDD